MPEPEEMHLVFVRCLHLAKSVRLQTTTRIGKFRYSL